MIKNWKTTAVGVAGAVCYALAAKLQSGTVSGKDLALSAIIAVLGTLAKDFNVSGK